MNNSEYLTEESKKAFNLNMKNQFEDLTQDVYVHVYEHMNTNVN